MRRSSVTALLLFWALTLGACDTFVRPVDDEPEPGADAGRLDAGPADQGPATLDFGPPADLGGPGDLAPPPDDASLPGPETLSIGRPGVLEIATWNLHNFPSQAETPTSVAHLLGTLDLDLVAVQEVADVAAFERTVAAAPAWAGLLSPDVYFTGEYQKTGFLYRTEQIELLDWSSLFDDDSRAFPRPPLEARFRVQRPEGEALELVAIVVHLKASGGADNEARRRAACERLDSYLDERRAAAPAELLVLLGDFNDKLSDPPAVNVFGPLLAEPEHYVFTTAELAASQEFSYIPSGSLIDHIVFSPALREQCAALRTFPLRAEQLVLDFDYLERISDHRPVVSLCAW